MKTTKNGPPAAEPKVERGSQFSRKISSWAAWQGDGENKKKGRKERTIEPERLGQGVAGRVRTESEKKKKEDNTTTHPNLGTKLYC